MITSRRTFLKTTALSGASLLIGIDENRLLHGAQPLAAGHFKPNVWIRIDPDNSVTLTIGKSEMGQGVRTSLAMLLAEELEADWTRIKLEQASPEPGFEDIGTGGSDSIRDGWRSLRQAGATAREMLAMAAEDGDALLLVARGFVGVIEIFNESTLLKSKYFNLTPVVGAGIAFVLITIPLARFTDYLVRRDQARMRAST